MSIFYTVDRKNTLQEGQVITLKNYTNILPEILQLHSDSIFPEGFTYHGEFYFLQNRAIGLNEIIELVFEYVRRSNFPQKPSRFQSVFASQTLEQARCFKQQYGNCESAIWEIECDNYFCADLKLLTMESSLIVMSYYAHQYWQGLSKDNEPNWEYLLIPPIKVLKKVE